MDEKAFNEKYYFNNLKMVTVVNPQSEDYTFGITLETGVDVGTGQPKSEAREYTIKAGSKERFPGVVANLYLDQMAKSIAQEEDKFTLYPDFSHRAAYYDDLIVDVEDMLNSQSYFPQYTEKVKETVEEVKEVPFAGLKETQDDQPKTSGESGERTQGSTKDTPSRAKAVGNAKK